MFGRKSRLALTALAVPFALSISGCATTGSADNAAMAKSDKPSRSAVYMHQINRAAERQNVRVIWVNPPKDDEETGLRYSLQATVGDEDAG